MILVTGAAGFIGSNIVSSLNKKGIQNIIICDWLNDKSKNKNINKLIYQNIVSPEDIFKYLDKNNNILNEIRSKTSSADEASSVLLNYLAS